MPNLRKLIALLLFVCAPGWAQSGPPPSTQDGAPKPAASEPPQTAPDFDKKPAPDQTPAAPTADSKNLEPIKTQKATYPYAAQDQAIQGEVIVKILVSESGDVESAEAVSGDPILAKSAVDAARKWKFKPFIKDGKPAKVWTKIPFDFAFSNKIMEKGVAADGSATSDLGSRAPSTDSSGPAAGSAPASAATPQRVRVSSGVTQSLLIRQIAPVYPHEARRNRIQGTVVLHAAISKEGRITDLKLISGPNELAPAAIGAVQQWRYRPYLLMGNPVEVDTEIQVNFKLSF